jgi:hypothetical protein
MAWRISGVGRVTVSLRKSTTGEPAGCAFISDTDL